MWRWSFQFPIRPSSRPLKSRKPKIFPPRLPTKLPPDARFAGTRPDAVDQADAKVAEVNVEAVATNRGNAANRSLIQRVLILLPRLKKPLVKPKKTSSRFLCRSR